MSLNSLVKKVADHYITLRSGNPNASFNEAVSEALRCYIVYEGETAPVDFNARVLKACDIYLTSQSDTSVGGFNQDVVKALRAYLTGENSSFIPYSFNEVLIAAANNFLNHYEGATVALDFTTNRYRVSGTSGYTTDFSSLSGLTVTRASEGYAERNDGTLVLFGQNVARITDKGLLVEEARTNLLFPSAGFSGWSGNSVVTTGAITAPDGTLTGASLAANATGSGSDRFKIDATTSAAVHQATVYLKYSNSQWVAINLYDGSNHVSYFDVLNGTTGANAAGNTSSITAVGSGWYRATVSRTMAAVATSGIGIGACDANSSQAVTIGKAVYAWGAQLEAGAFPTSYIPTTTASATRAADVVSIGGLSVANPMTLLATADHPAYDGASQIQATLAVNTDANNRLVLFRTGGQVIQALATAGGVSVYQQNSANKAGARTIRSGMSYDGTYRSAVDGVANTSTSAVYLTGTVNNLFLGAQQAGATQLNGYLRRALIYPRAFTDAELQAATA